MVFFFVVYLDMYNINEEKKISTFDTGKSKPQVAKDYQVERYNSQVKTKVSVSSMTHR